jgi:hypothetical protein
LQPNYHKRHVYFGRAKAKNIKSKSALNTMKTQLRITRPNNNNHLNDATGFRGFLLGNILRKAALLASVATVFYVGRKHLRNIRRRKSALSS